MVAFLHTKTSIGTIGAFTILIVFSFILLEILLSLSGGLEIRLFSLYMITLNPEKKTSFTRFVTKPGWQTDLILYDGPADGTLFYFFWLKDQ